MKKYCVILAAVLVFCFSFSNIDTKGAVYGASNIKISKTSLKLTVGNSKKLKVTGTTKNIKWSSSKKSVATVSNTGKVKAKKKGTATITAKVGSKNFKCKVTVKDASTKKYITNKNFQGTFMLNGTGSFETGWYAIVIDSITSDGYVRFQVNCGSRNGSRIAETDVFKKRINGNKVKFAYSEDGHGNKGKGTITFNSNKTLHLKLTRTYTGEYAYYGLNDVDDTFKRTSKNHQLDE